jgi:hypothetical protein
MKSNGAIFLFAAATLVQVPVEAQNSVVPGGFQGRWASDQTRCMSLHDSRLSVSEDEFLFYESRAKVLSARQTGPQEVEFEMESSGEGQTRREVRRFVLSPDGGTLTDVTSPAQFVRVRCEQVPLPFVDEASNDPDFLAFRTRLLEAVASRDTAFILSLVSDGILNSLGGDGGIDEFIRHWQLDAEVSRFWTEFETLLRLGGAFMTDDRFLAPYTAATWQNTNLDGFDYSAVIGANVNVRSEPSLTAPVVSRMSYQTVREARSISSDEWVPVRLTDGGTAYINKRYVRSPISYRAMFERSNGRWELTAFLAGD